MPDTLRSHMDCELEDSPRIARETHYKNIVHLWEFLLELLANENCRSIIAWTREDRGEFKVQNPHELAKRWGMFKKKRVMTYENLSRSLRYYYKQGIIKKAPNKKLMYKFHKLPYNYKPGVTRSRHHGNRINACIEQEERSETKSRHVHEINVCAEQQEPDVTTSRHTHRNTGCSEQQGPGSSMSRKKENWMDACTSQRKAHSAPPQTISIGSTTRSAFTPVTTPVGRRQSVPLISTPLRPLPWYPDPTPLVPPLSTAQPRIIAPVAVETMTFGIEPYVPVSQPVEQVAPIVHVAATTPSSIRVSVIKRTQPF